MRLFNESTAEWRPFIDGGSAAHPRASQVRVRDIQIGRTFGKQAPCPCNTIDTGRPRTRQACGPKVNPLRLRQVQLGDQILARAAKVNGLVQGRMQTRGRKGCDPTARADQFVDARSVRLFDFRQVIAIVPEPTGSARVKRDHCVVDGVLGQRLTGG